MLMLDTLSRLARSRSANTLLDSLPLSRAGSWLTIKVSAQAENIKNIASDVGALLIMLLNRVRNLYRSLLKIKVATRGNTRTIGIDKASSAINATRVMAL